MVAEVSDNRYGIENCLIGAINSANGEANNIQNTQTGEWGPVPKIAVQYRDKNIPWVVVGQISGSPRSDILLTRFPQVTTTTERVPPASMPLLNHASSAEWR
jgi:hypothetical protein